MKSSLTFTVWSQRAENELPVTLRPFVCVCVCVCVCVHSLASDMCVRVVVLIRPAVHFGSVSRPGSGFGEVRAISTRLLQLRRLFFFFVLIRQSRATGAETESSGGDCCRWCLAVLVTVMMCWRSAGPRRSAPSLPRPAQRSASGFPSVFPKLHWFWPLYLGGPGPLALAVTLRWQKNTESWQRCSRRHKAWGFCRRSLLFLGYCFVTVKGGKKTLFEEFVRLFFLPLTRDLELF